jgi:hypothetical protein
MKDEDPSWKKLVEAARRAPVPPDEAAPFGFSTRVAALAFEQGRPASSPFARLSVRAAAVAFLLAAIAVGVNYPAIIGAFDDQPGATSAGDDPVAEVVNLGS